MEATTGSHKIIRDPVTVDNGYKRIIDTIINRESLAIDGRQLNYTHFS